MTTGHIGNRHAGLGCLGQHGELLIQRIPPAALDTGKDLDSIGTVRHRRITRRKPRSSLRSYVRFKWGPLQSAIPPVEIGEVEREKEELAARAALQGIESLEGAYMQVSEAAKAIGMGANFSVANRMLSKFAHPTAMQVLAPAGEAEKLALQKQLFFSHGCLFFRGSFDAIEAALIDAAG